MKLLAANRRHTAGSRRHVTVTPADNYQKDAADQEKRVRGRAQVVDQLVIFLGRFGLDLKLFRRCDDPHYGGQKVEKPGAQ